jgi:nitronate monooxygenase
MLSKILDIRYPIIMAPMFLVTNNKMMIEALNNGIAACIPALNFRTTQDIDNALNTIREKSLPSGLGVNLIANKSNFKLEEQLQICIKNKVNFIITSLGNPKRIIEECKQNNIKVFCDVIDVKHAIKVEKLGADALIAVNKRAGGHAGKMSAKELIAKLKSSCQIPIISAGGIGTKEQISQILNYGAIGVSIGSPFIACHEADISTAYKQACVDYNATDIVMTNKISGTPCTVINTPYVKKVGTNQNIIERFLSRNKKIRKWIKRFTFYYGMKTISKSAFGSTYKTVWCAGPSIQYTDRIMLVKNIIKKLTTHKK